MKDVLTQHLSVLAEEVEKANGSSAPTVS